MNAPQLPIYPSSRLLGVELELDVGSGRTFNLPALPQGWIQTIDGSLTQGHSAELVMVPPKVYSEAIPTIKSLCERLVDMNVLKTGGMHIHVQAHDYSHTDAYNLVRIYTRFQPVISKLVGESRRHNRFCPIYPKDISRTSIVDKFTLNSPAHNRAEAKRSRVYSVVNLAMLRCIQPEERSVEFRQGSVSKKAICVGGWAALMVALVEMAKIPLVVSRLDTIEEGISFSALFELFKELLGEHESRVGATGLAVWVDWRHSYLNGRPTMEQARKIVKGIAGGYKGLFFISRLLDTNLAYAKRVLELAVRERLIVKHATKERWMVAYETIAASDLARLERLGRSEGTIVEETMDEVEEVVDAIAAADVPRT
jgi:hypothetical protein